MYTPGLILGGTRTQCPFDFFYVFTKNFICACCLGRFRFHIALNLLKHAHSYRKYAVFLKYALYLRQWINFSLQPNLYR